MKDEDTFEVLGQTLDDAVGEAFDKSGKLLGLPYPAGPLIDKNAKLGEPRFEFPIPQIDGLDFSFSGVKTAIMYFLRDEKKKDPAFMENNMNDICASIQHTLVEILSRKILQAAEEYHITEIAVAGGVAANSGLRQALGVLGEKLGWNLYFPAMQYCTDNAGMIAMAGYLQFQKGRFSGLDAKPYVRGM